MTGPAVAVTPRSLSGGGHPALQRLVDAGFTLVTPAPGRLPTPAELAAVLPGCVGYLAGVEPVPGSLLRTCPNLRVIARNGVGVDNVDLAAARELGIAVEPAVGANAQGVAELAVALTFAAVRHVPWTDARLKEGRWERRQGVELAGRTMGVVGLGQVGRRVAGMAAGIGMAVLGFDTRRDPAWTPPTGFAWADLDDLFARADVVSLHAPPGPAPLVDAARLAASRPGLVLVNTARAQLVDRTAVRAALDSGALGAYAVDAFATEPPEDPDDLALVGHDRVLATAHVGGYTEESVGRATDAAVTAVLRVLTGAGAPGSGT